MTDFRELDQEVAARLAAIIDSSDDAIVSKTLDGVITSWNPAAERMFGYTAAEAVGRRITLIIPDDHLGEEEELLARIRRGEGVHLSETERIRKDGRRIAISLTVSPIKDATGRVIGASKIARDVSERQLLERLREQLLVSENTARRAAESANRAKDAFLAMLGHELRNPLAAIATSVAILERTEREEHAAHARQVIARQVEHLTCIVDDLLDVSSVIAGKIRLHRRPVDLGAEVTRCLGTLQATGKLARHDVSIDAESVWVEADVVRLHQIVTNLLDNAAKYTPPGGRIRVSVRFEAGSVGSGAGHAVLFIEDSGLGIVGELLPRIFDLFLQAPSPTDQAHRGLGIGLTLVRRLVELHGGTVQALSEGPGRGSAFIVRLRARVAPGPELRPPEAEEGSASHRIVIVEDDRDARETLRALLELSGHQVSAAEDGSTGVSEILRVRPAIAFIDIGLPGLDGYEVAARVRTDPRLQKTLLVALTGYGPESPRRWRAAGFDAFFVKPITPAHVSELFAVLAQRAERLSPN